MQLYETPTMTSEMHSFIPSGIELLAFSSKNPFLDNSEAEASSRSSVIGTSYQGLGNPGGNLGNWKSSFNVPQNRSNTVWAAPSIVVPNNMQQQQHHGGLPSYSGQIIPNPIVIARGGSMQVGSSGDIRKGDMEVASQNPHHQTDGTHLYLMNPKYPNEYPEGTSTAAANMTEIRPTNGLNPQGFEAQKNILEFPHFATQIPTIISEANPSLRETSHGTGSDLPGNGNMQHSQLMLAQFNNTLNWANRFSGSQSWNREPFIENKVDESFRSEYSSKGQDGSGQRLSLSLSSHQPSEIHLPDIANQTNVLQFGGDAKSKLGDLFNSAHGTDGLAYNISSYSRNGIPGKGIMDSIQGGGRSAILQYMKDGSTGAFAGYGLSLKNSRYLKAAQEILYEFCNVGRGIETKTSPKQKLSMEVNVIPGSSSSRSHEFGAKTETGMMNQQNQPFYPGDRFELQRRKAKLVSMLDEVDRRYRNYCDQMQLVVSSFESVSTLGAAAPYTSLALKAMSRHFRCLKDAITGQLQVTIKALGEKGSVVPGTSRGETPRLGFLERSIRQQRAFHHLGLMEQHPWRPQRGLPERSVSVLRAWLFEHFLHPYPTDADKHILAKQTGLTRSQVSNWFINARVRLWKPMVEEMYIEEIKEEKVDQVGQNAEAERSTGTNNDEKTMFNSGGVDNKCTANSEEAAFKLDHSSSTTSQTAQADISSGNVTLHLQSKDPEMAVARETSESLSSMNTSHEGDMKLDEAPGYNIFEQDKGFRNELYANKFQTAGHTGMSVDFSSYNNTTASTTVAAYSHGDLTPRHFANSGVSLTLGLRHSGGLSYNPLNEQKYDNNIYFSRVQDDADPSSQYSMLDNEVSPGNGFMQEQDIQYRNYIVNGSRLLHDFVG